jgi:hypothetical protein
MKSRLGSSIACALFMLATWCGGTAISGAEGGMKSVEIVDPILNMRAYSLNVPSKWVFDGAVIQGSKCLGIPFVVFRSESPDGLTGIKSLPRLDWSWSENSKYGPKAGSDCMPYSSEIPASDVLKYMVGILKVKYVKKLSTPNLAALRERLSARDTPTFTTRADQASASVTYHINKIEIQERLDVSVTCSTSTLALFGRIHQCSSFVSRAHAPLGKWSNDTFSPIGKSLMANPEWQQKWTELMQQNAAASGAMVRGALETAGRERTAQHNAFMQAQDMRQHQHEEFLATMQRGTDMSMQRAAESADANHRAADDWADYSLDRQKRLDPNTGEITKDSSAYSYTWVNESGQRIQTNDVNENPNGRGTGNWVLQENVR